MEVHCSPQYRSLLPVQWLGVDCIPKVRFTLLDEQNFIGLVKNRQEVRWNSRVNSDNVIVSDCQGVTMSEEFGGIQEDPDFLPG